MTLNQKAIVRSLETRIGAVTYTRVRGIRNYRERTLSMGLPAPGGLCRCERNAQVETLRRSGPAIGTPACPGAP